MAAKTAANGTVDNVKNVKNIMCGACGVFLKETDKFCNRCGVRLKQENRWHAEVLGNSLHDTENIKAVRELLGTLMRITIVDDRIFIGKLMCFDKDKNIILSECTEYRRVEIPDQGVREEKRAAGLVMIGGEFLKRVERAHITEEGKKQQQEAREKAKKEEAQEKDKSQKSSTVVNSTSQPAQTPTTSEPAQTQGQ